MELGHTELGVCALDPTVFLLFCPWCLFHSPFRASRLKSFFYLPPALGRQCGTRRRVRTKQLDEPGAQPEPRGPPTILTLISPVPHLQHRVLIPLRVAPGAGRAPHRPHHSGALTDGPFQVSVLIKHTGFCLSENQWVIMQFTLGGYSLTD